MPTLVTLVALCILFNVSASGPEKILEIFD
jgi:hypothetical protein